MADDRDHQGALNFDQQERDDRDEQRNPLHQGDGGQNFGPIGHQVDNQQQQQQQQQHDALGGGDNRNLPLPQPANVVNQQQPCYAGGQQPYVMCL